MEKGCEMVDVYWNENQMNVDLVYASHVAVECGHGADALALIESTIDCGLLGDCREHCGEFGHFFARNGYWHAWNAVGQHGYRRYLDAMPLSVDDFFAD